MKRKNGFTLIELLAVIVILAIIALIAVPIIMNVINEAKKGAAKDSMYGYIEAIELEVAKSILTNQNLLTGDYTTKTGDLYSGSTKVVSVSFKGNRPEDGGTVTLTKGRVTKAELTFGGHAVTYNGKVDGGASVTPTPAPTGPYAMYAYNPDLVSALENGSLSVAPESWFAISNGMFTCTNFPESSLVVPSEINGEKVTKVNFLSGRKENITGLYLPNTVTFLGTYAFRDLPKITALVLPSSLTQMDSWIFDGATSLKNIKFTGTTPPTIVAGDNGTFRGLTLSENKIYVPKGSKSAYQNVFGPSLPNEIQIVEY